MPHRQPGALGDAAQPLPFERPTLDDLGRLRVGQLREIGNLELRVTRHEQNSGVRTAAATSLTAPASSAA